MSSFRPAVRVNTPVIVGLSGPTKSGKTYSALRLARGLAKNRGGRAAMINCEGARGHQYADKFEYDTLDLTAPFTPQKYIDAVKAAQSLKPAALIIDSMSHMHDGPGGLLEMHDANLDRMAGEDRAKRDRMTWTAWIAPKRAENEFIYTLLACDFPVVLCFRAKEKIKIVKGQPPVDLGFQPIASDRIAFETLFSLMLLPHSKGVPEKALSEMREPFDSMIEWNAPVNETFGERIAEWAIGKSNNGAAPLAGQPPPLAEQTTASGPTFISADQVTELGDMLRDNGFDREKFCTSIKVTSLQTIPADKYQAAKARIADAIEKRRATA